MSPKKHLASVAELKSIDGVTGISSQTSKVTTQKNSLKNSRVKGGEMKSEDVVVKNRY